MAIGGDPKISLVFLYKHDSFYSFCLADLLMAPQQVKNRIIKEQKELAKVKWPISLLGIWKIQSATYDQQKWEISALLLTYVPHTG